MSITSRALLILTLLAAAVSIARSDGISNPGFVTDGFSGGISSKTGSGSGGGCHGVIDASAGCPLPMLGS